MTISPVTAQSGRAWVASIIDAIRLLIVQRTLRVGDRLPTEAELARLLGSERYPVREAIGFLVNWQMLELRAGGGVYVARDVDATEEFRLRNRSGIRDHLEMQHILEGKAARLAARRRNLDDIRRLRRCLALRGEYSASDDLEDFLLRDRELHLAIALASHNSALLAVYRSFSVATRSHNKAMFADGLLPEPDLAAHAVLVEAIIYGDEAAAGQAVNDMLEPLIEQLHTLLKPVADADSSTASHTTLWV